MSENTPPKKVVFGREAHEKLDEGVNILARAVGSTLGPKGRFVVIEAKYGSPVVTRDGVTVAKHTNVDEPVQNLAMNIVKQAADKSNTIAGDGTTTATVLTAALVNQGRNLDASPIEVSRAYDKFLADTLKELDQLSAPVKKGDIKRIATISANNDEELGDIIEQAFNYASASGLITVEDSRNYETSVEKVEGSHIDSGFLSPWFITDGKKEISELVDPLILITDNKISDPNQFFSIMQLAKEEDRSLLVIADDIDAQSLAIFSTNVLRGNIKGCAIKAPAFGDRRIETLKDLAALTGATMISESAGLLLKNTKLEHFGTCEKAIIGKEETILVSPDKDTERVEERLAIILAELEKYTDGYNYDKLVERRARLNGALAIIRAGAATETDLKEKRFRIDDALRATRAAVESGYLTGGGVPLALIAATYLKPDSDEMSRAFGHALSEPLKVIASNAGKVGEEVFEELITKGKQFNALTNTYTMSLVDDGVIDPTMVTKQALINAVSAAKMLLLCSTALYETSRTPAYNPGSLEDYAN